MGEEGFINTLKNAPELIIATAIIGVILIRWAVLNTETRRTIREK